MCYSYRMVRVTFLLDEPEHDRLAAAAARRGVSKAAVLRDLIDEQLPKPNAQPLPRWQLLLDQMDVEPLEGSVDDYLYGSEDPAG